MQPCKVLCQYHCHTVLEGLFRRFIFGLPLSCVSLYPKCWGYSTTLNMFFSPLVTQRLHRLICDSPVANFIPFCNRNRHWIMGQFAQHLKTQQLIIPEIFSTESFSLFKNLQARKLRYRCFLWSFLSPRKTQVVLTGETSPGEYATLI